MFLSTALASIISASGGTAGQAVILYEAALGLDLAVGPLVGGLLGDISWMVPFWGTATLLVIGFVAIIAFVRGSGKPEQKSPASVAAVTLSISQEESAAVTILKTANPPTISAAAAHRPGTVTG
jgi:MFS transporter, ACDE family, multidrug resistance protein